MLSTGLAEAPIECDDIEFVTFEPPSGQTCAQYMSSYISAFGGYLRDDSATTECAFCASSSTNDVLGGLGINFDERWRNFGLMMIYVIFNLFAALALYWLLRVPKRQRSKEMKSEEALARQRTSRNSVQERRAADVVHSTHELTLVRPGKGK
jgi:ATP-binding cassette, subfamily G (WHITE), member 2, PDR